MAGGTAPAQTQEDIVPPAPTAAGFGWSGVLLAVSSALIVHLILTGPFGVTLRIPELPGSSTLVNLSVLDTTLVTFAFGLLGWLALALLQRWRPDSAVITWTMLALAVWLLSLAAVATLDTTPGGRWGLVAVHTAVAAVLIPSFRAGTARQAGSSR